VYLTRGEGDFSHNLYLSPEQISPRLGQRGAIPGKESEENRVGRSTGIGGSIRRNIRYGGYELTFPWGARDATKRKHEVCWRITAVPQYGAQPKRNRKQPVTRFYPWVENKVITQMREMGSFLVRSYADYMHHYERVPHISWSCNPLSRSQQKLLRVTNATTGA
jgi:hypothetical protein